MCSVTQSCLTLWDPMDCSLAGSSVHGIFQARILEQVAISHFRGSFWHRYQIHASAGRFFIAAPPGKSCTMPTGLYNYLHKCPSNSIIQSICYQTFTEHIQCARHCPSLWGSMFHKTNLFQNLHIVYLYILLEQKQGDIETKNQLRSLTIPDLVIEFDPESTFQVSVQWTVVSIRSGAWY